MTRIDRAIHDIDGIICKDISKINLTDRGTESQNILSQLRNFVEHIALKECFGSLDADVDYSNITRAISYMQTRGELSFLRRFHDLLQKSVSHYCQPPLLANTVSQTFCASFCSSLALS